jgi:hypothetical protein
VSTVTSNTSKCSTVARRMNSSNVRTPSTRPVTRSTPSGATITIASSKYAASSSNRCSSHARLIPATTSSTAAAGVAGVVTRAEG